MMDPIVRIATNPQMSEKLGISDEQKTKLKELKSGGRNSETQKKVREATERQAELLNADKIDEAAVMKAVDEVFELRKEMAKEQIRRVIAVKSILTSEQIAKALEAVKSMSGPRDERSPRRGPPATSLRPSLSANSLDGRRRRAHAVLLPRRRLVARGARRPSFGLDAGASARPPADGGRR